jgi:hypothetical protein
MEADMGRKLLRRGVTSLWAIALGASVPASAGDGTSSAMVPGNTIPGQQAVDHAPDFEADPIRRMPAAAGINAVRPSVSALKLPPPHLPTAVPVPPTQELQVLDPNVDPLGRPTVKVSEITGPDGLKHIDIPPCVIIHMFYYTGDRSFQGPMLPGGPTIVVLNHPADGERLYIEIQMPPGAPRITYTRHSVEYNYGFQTIVLTFALHGRPKVTMRQGVSGLTEARMARQEARQAASRFIARTGLPEARRKIRAQAQNVARSAADRIHDVGKAAAGPIVSIVKLIPGINLLTSNPEQSVENERDTLVQTASATLSSTESSIKTVR